MNRAADRDFRDCFFTSQDNLRLYYRDWGDPLSPRLPVLCLPGLTRNSRDFESFARRLSPSRRVVCPDYRGRGRSAYDPDCNNYQPASYIGDLRHLMAASGLHRCVVVGTSLGGLLAMSLAAAQPTALAGFVTNDIGPAVNPGGLGRILDYIAEDRPQPDWPSAVAAMRALFPMLGLRTEEDWLAFARGTFREGEDKLLHYDWDVRLVKPLLDPRFSLGDLWPLYRAAAAFPMLALRGEISDVLSRETFERMAEIKPDLIRVTVPGLGHAPTLNEPEAKEAIDDFLARLDA